MTDNKMTKNSTSVPHVLKTAFSPDFDLKNLNYFPRITRQNSFLSGFQYISSQFLVRIFDEQTS